MQRGLRCGSSGRALALSSSPSTTQKYSIVAVLHLGEAILTWLCRVPCGLKYSNGRAGRREDVTLHETVMETASLTFHIEILLPSGLT
jgi:hypothetical protein